MTKEKVFCLFCISFKPRSWRLGWCAKKMIYINKVVRNCAQSNITEYTLNNPAETLAWYYQSAEWAKIRYELVKQYHYIGDIELEEV